MRKVKEVKEEIRKDVNEYMRQAEKLDEINEFDGAVILHHKDDERTTFIFNPTSRLGRFIVGFVKWYER